MVLIRLLRLILVFRENVFQNCIPTIDRHIALLAKSNLIEHRDSDKTGGYYVKKDEDRG